MVFMCSPYLRRHVAQDRARPLPVLAGHLTSVLLAPILGPERAVDAILAEHARVPAGAGSPQSGG